jgi:hypothetical protein
MCDGLAVQTFGDLAVLAAADVFTRAPLLTPCSRSASTSATGRSFTHD